uniref:Uncharacterized protein n=1 Tax=Cacopsylla melanoneura TaxID=428564 RepID=A0A8D8T4S7_9HEMI
MMSTPGLWYSFLLVYSVFTIISGDGGIIFFISPFLLCCDFRGSVFGESFFLFLLSLSSSLLMSLELFRPILVSFVLLSVLSLLFSSLRVRVSRSWGFFLFV